MKSIDDILDLAATRPPVKLTIQPFGDVYLRYPTMEEWHQITASHRDAKDGVASVGLIAKTIATCLADEKGERLMSQPDAGRLLDRDPRAVMALYKACFDTVLRIDDQAVDEAEKN